MLIGFENAKLEKQCNKKKDAQKLLPDDIPPEKLFRRIGNLADFNNLGEIPFRAPPLDFHPLRENHAGMYAVKLSAKWRIIFRPIGEFEKKADGSPSLETVTQIEIHKIENYHKGQ